MQGFIGRKGNPVSRRSLLASLSALPFADTLFAQGSGIRLLRLQCFEIRVTDPAASLEFYQSLFGMAVQARDEDRHCLRVGDGPQFMAMRAVGAGETPAITRIGYAVENFEPRRTQAALEAVGFARVPAPPESAAGLDHRMQTWIRQRGDTEELYFADDRGLIVQLAGADYCGGSGAGGSFCASPEPVADGLIRLADLNHFTVFVSDGAAANRFYQETFGLSVQAYQGPQSPVTGIGDGRQFVMYAGGGGRGGRGGAATPANIHHGSFNIHDFDVDRVLATLTDFGIAAQGESAIGPRMHYVSRRMPARGGAEGGTPELYFTDPDGILMQLQDISYCGGGGYLGNECLADGASASVRRLPADRGRA
jgi:catechol 2,3-dioxygenase-like lactoylglutathione lyase family enzyme